VAKQTETTARLSGELTAERRENAALRRQLDQGGSTTVKRSLAVERLRAEAMAMRASADLLQLIGMMCQEMVDLGFDTLGASIRFVAEDGSGVKDAYYAIKNPKRHGIGWVSADLVEYSDAVAVGRVPVSGPVDSALMEAWHSGETKVVLGTVKDYESRLVAIAKAWGMERLFPVPDRTEWTFTYVPFSHGVVSFIEHRSDPQQRDIVRDLAEALSLGYIRFLDFRRLEQHNRDLSRANADLKLEAALERVRASALGMQRSEDLIEVSCILNDELAVLDDVPARSSITVWDEDKDQWRSWVTRSASKLMEGETRSIVYDEPLRDFLATFPAHAEILQAWKRGEPHHTLVLTGRERSDFFRLFQKRFGRTDAWYEEVISVAPDPCVMHQVFYSQGYIEISPEGPLDKEGLGVVKRFADVFDIAYRRYGELQRSEAARVQLHERNRDLSQANADLTLEAALERVRARALGMQKSEDLIEVSSVLSDELVGLGNALFRLTITVWDEERDQWRSWATRKRLDQAFDGSKSTVYDESLQWIMSALSVFRRGFDAWKRGERHFAVRLSGEERIEYLSRIKESFKRPDSWFQEILAVTPDPWVIHQVFFSQGNIEINQGESMTQEELRVVERFAGVFDIAYRRYGELRQAEDARLQLQEKNQALEENLRLLRETQNQLVQQEKMASLGDLVAGVAHEMNTPLGSIRSMHDTLMRALDKLRSRLDGDALQERPTQAILKVIDDANRVIAGGTERVNTIVSSLKNFARLDEAQFQAADLHEGIDSALTLLTSQLGGRIEVVRDYGEIPPVHCAPGQLNQVFMHLLKNAIQAIEGSGCITVSTFEEDEAVHVCFSDTGRGMDPEEVGRLFEFDFRAGGDRVKMGFGLAADLKIIQDHKGKLKATSQKGEGTQMTVELPLGTDL
jgi:signal transduction histidine kinase